MGFACTLLGHKWNHCRCERCGETKGLGQYEISSHDWNGCTCRVCGQIWDIDGLHDWDGCKCRICGKTRDAGHQLVNGVCKKCGKRISKEALMKAFTGRSYRISPRELEDNHPSDQLAMAFEALSPQDADEVLVKAYKAVIDAYGGEMGTHLRIDDRMRDVIVPYVNASNLPLLYQADQLHIRRVCRHLDKEIVLQACRESFQDDKSRKQFLKSCKVADGVLVTLCEIGNHDFRFDRYWESGFSGTADSTEVSYEYAIYRCTRCGYEEKRPTGRHRVL